MPSQAKHVGNRISNGSPPGDKNKASISRSVTPLPGIVDYCQKESDASSSSLAIESYHNYIDHQHAHRAQAVASPFDYFSQEDLNHMIKEQPYRTNPRDTTDRG
uniref:Uncharacterized protein n=1 Tax=Cacopsylla melanoneura TaxID=428564 RepID=A0A8D9B159_9HEMI